MKTYRYIKCSHLEEYDDWEIVQIIPGVTDEMNDMAVIMKEDEPIQNYIKLNEATNEELISELLKRLKEN